MKTNRKFAVLALLQLLLVGWSDYATGFEVSLVVFYFVPIAYAAWFLGLGWSMVFALLSAATLTWAEVAAGRRYSHTWIMWEHALMRMMVFGFVAFSFSFFRRTLDREREKVRRLEGSMLTFCACCSKVRDPRDNWVELETFLRENTSVETRSTLCPTCSREAYAATGKTVEATKL